MTDAQGRGRSGRSRRRSRRPSAGLLLKGGLALLFLVVASWMTVAVSGAALFRKARPDIALRLAPFDARAKAALAEQGLRTPTDGRTLPAAAELSREALRRDPTIVGAWRNLGLAAAAAGQQPVALRLFRISQRLSRRDSATQLWLIEENVRRNDIRGALRHYDIALRTSTAMSDILVPILVSATADPAIAGPLADVLAPDPPWAYAYYNHLVQALPSGQAALALISRLPAEVRRRHIEPLRQLVAKAVDKREYEAAWRIYALLSGAAPGELLRNGDFRSRNEFPVLEWQLTDTPNLRAEQTAPAGSPGASALRVSASSAAIGSAARQLLLLGPGSYRLRSVAAQESSPGPERLQWQVNCVGRDENLLNLDVTPRREGRFERQGRFRVPPSGCPAQWLRLEVSAPDLPAGVETWVHRVEILPAEGGRE